MVVCVGEEVVVREVVVAVAAGCALVVPSLLLPPLPPPPLFLPALPAVAVAADWGNRRKQYWRSCSLSGSRVR